MIETKINKNLCKGCGICVEFCPKHILKIGDERNRKGVFYCQITDQDQCIACLSCAMMCPEGAIETSKSEGE